MSGMLRLIVLPSTYHPAPKESGTRLQTRSPMPNSSEPPPANSRIATPAPSDIFPHLPTSPRDMPLLFAALCFASSKVGGAACDGDYGRGQGAHIQSPRNDAGDSSRGFGRRFGGSRAARGLHYVHQLTIVPTSERITKAHIHPTPAQTTAWSEPKKEVFAAVVPNP